ANATVGNSTGVHRTRPLAPVRGAPGTVPDMYKWSDEQLMIRDAVRQFVDAEIAPRRDEFEHGDTPPYDVLRKLFATFGMDVMARERFKAQIERERAGASATRDDGDGAGR